MDFDGRLETGRFGEACVQDRSSEVRKELVMEERKGSALKIEIKRKVSDPFLDSNEIILCQKFT